MSTADAGPGSGGYRGSARGPVGLPARSYDAGSGPAGPGGPAGRGRGPFGAPARAGPRCRPSAGPAVLAPARGAVLERRGRGRSVGRSVGRSAQRPETRDQRPETRDQRPETEKLWSRLADRPPIVRARSAATKFLPCAVCGHSPRPRRSAGRKGVCPGSVPHFCAPPPFKGVYYFATPPFGGPYPPLGGVVPPPWGVSAPFSGHIGLWTTNGQPMDNQQTTNGSMAENQPHDHPVDRL
jgi:hypothetical protein